MPEASGEDLDLRADGGLVVGVAFEVDLDGVVPIAAVVAEKRGGAVELGDEHVGVPVSVGVKGDEGAGGLGEPLVEAEAGSDVFKFAGAP